MVKGEIRRLEAGSAPVVARSGEQRADSASGRPPPATVVRIRQRRQQPVDGLGGPVGGLAGLIHGVLFVFCFFIRFTEADIQPPRKNTPFTVTFVPRLLQCPPRLIVFARLEKVFL
jgi:hypothetical protein